MHEDKLNVYHLCDRVIGVVTDLKPAYPSLRCAEVRSRTFEDYPFALRHLVPSLVRAGFFYQHRSDHVTCHFCSVILLNWNPQDDPIKEHVWASPRCFYANLLAPRHDSNERGAFADTLPPEVTTAPRTPVKVNKVGEETLKLNNEAEGDDKSKEHYGTCHVCFLKLIEIVYLPCGHVSCSQCFINLKELFCPMCRSAILATKRLYL